MKITKRQLRKIIRESILIEMLPPGHPVPRSVQADYDIANKEDTFPNPMHPKNTRGIPKASGPQPSRKELKRILSDLNLISDSNVSAKDIVSISLWPGPAVIWLDGKQWDIMLSSKFHNRRVLFLDGGAQEYGEWNNGRWDMMGF